MNIQHWFILYLNLVISADSKPTSRCIMWRCFPFPWGRIERWYQKVREKSGSSGNSTGWWKCCWCVQWAVCEHTNQVFQLTEGETAVFPSLALNTCTESHTSIINCLSLRLLWTNPTDDTGKWHWRFARLMSTVAGGGGERGGWGNILLCACIARH